MDIRYVEQFKVKLSSIGDYTLIGEYLGARIPCTIQGPCGHQWSITSGNFFSRGTGKLCPICYNTGAQYSSNTFAEKIKLKYNLNLIGEYVNVRTTCKVSGICGHEWLVNPSGLLSQGNLSSCPKCSTLWTEKDTVLLTKLYSEDLIHIKDISRILDKTEEQIRYKVHKLNITRNGRSISLERDTRFFKIKELLEKDSFTNIRESSNRARGNRIDYICSKGHNIEGQLSNNIFSHNRRCPICSESSKISKGETELYEYLYSILPKDTWIIRNDRIILEGKELDIVLPDLGIALEYNGNYYHSDDRGKDNLYHLDKFNRVSSFGYRLIYITDEEWLVKSEITKSRLCALLGLNNKIFARKCSLEEISFKECAEFCIKNHIQGEAKTSINLGLFLEGDLVAIMSFSKSRYSKEYQYELVRYCSKLNINIIGGASKLLKYFEKTYLPESIGSYSDRRWNTGGLYTKLMFNFIHNSPPNYRYFKSGKTYSRQQFMKHKLKYLFPEIYSEEKTEKEIMIEAGYYRVYDCGNSLFIKKY